MQAPAAFRPELIFALVGPAGVRLAALSRAIVEHLANFGYASTEIRLSELLRNYCGWSDPVDSTEYTRIKHGQRKAYELRAALNNGAALALAGIAAIRQKRAAITSNPDQPASNHAYVIRQLKHPQEVEVLRRVYGSSVIVIGGHAPEAIRVSALALEMAQIDCRPADRTYTAKAEEIVHVDDKEERSDIPGAAADMGQNTRDTYPLADFFADLGRESGENGVRRFVDLLFGHPFHTPVPDEYAMYQASAGALRSSDESRQVGAIIATLTGSPPARITNVDIVAAGMNEVPRRGGGFYWHDDSPDGRDQWLKTHRQVDRAQDIKVNALTELISRFREQGLLAPPFMMDAANKLARDLLPHLKGTQFMDIGEFGRTVHAEMAALIDSARRGVPVHGLTMYVTAFPCHNCAKHIIAAGIMRVVYLEPYPKSRAQFLHGEEINLDSRDGSSDDRVVFSAYTGVAPRQYGTLFSMAKRGRKKGIALEEWNAVRVKLGPRYILQNVAGAYCLTEREELKALDQAVYVWDKACIAP